MWLAIADADDWALPLALRLLPPPKPPTLWLLLPMTRRQPSPSIPTTAMPVGAASMLRGGRWHASAQRRLAGGLAEARGHMTCFAPSHQCLRELDSSSPSSLARRLPPSSSVVLASAALYALRSTCGLNEAWLSCFGITPFASGSLLFFGHRLTTLHSGRLSSGWWKEQEVGSGLIQKCQAGAS